MELAKFLNAITVINGIPPGKGEELGVYANTIECLAAQWVKHEKDRVGNVYLTRPCLMPSEDDVFIEYVYIVRAQSPAGCDITVELVSRLGDEGHFGPGKPHDFLSYIEEVVKAELD